MSSKAITYSEVGAGKGFYALLVLFSAMCVAGFFSFLRLEHEGHHITGMNNQIVWGLPHVFAIFLIVAASGVLNVASIGTVFRKKVYQPLGRLSALLAVSLLVGGLVILVLDLGRADRLIVAMTHYNFKSVFAWNIILYNGFLVLVGLYIWSMMDRKLKAVYPYVGFMVFIWRLVLTMGTGSIFGFLVARQFYDAAIMAPLFIAMSLSLGLALREGGIYTWLFWVVQIFLGSLVPLSLIFCRFLAKNRLSLWIAAGLVVIGGLAQLYVILIGGQVFPLVLFPGATVESTYFDGSVSEYYPGTWEVMLGLGGVGLMLLLVAVGLRVLRFLPESLSDSLLDKKC